MEGCIFCKIANKEIPTTVLYEDEYVIAFPDINPLAPVHILIIPKEHFRTFNDLTDDQKGEKIAGRLMMAAKKLAKEKGIDQHGYKILLRSGKNGGQEVFHVHVHLLGGARLYEDIHPID